MFTTNRIAAALLAISAAILAAVIATAPTKASAQSMRNMTVDLNNVNTSGCPKFTMAQAATSMWIVCNDGSHLGFVRSGPNELTLVRSGGQYTAPVDVSRPDPSWPGQQGSAVRKKKMAINPSSGPCKDANGMFIRCPQAPQPAPVYQPQSYAPAPSYQAPQVVYMQQPQPMQTRVIVMQAQPTWVAPAWQPPVWVAPAPPMIWIGPRWHRHW